METCERWWGYKHQWSKWEVSTEGNLLNRNNDIVGTMVIQRRKCSVCGFLEFNEQKIRV